MAGSGKSLNQLVAGRLISGVGGKFIDSRPTIFFIHIEFDLLFRCRPTVALMYNHLRYSFFYSGLEVDVGSKWIMS